MKRIVIKGLVSLVICALIGGFIGTSVLIYFSFNLPPVSGLQNYTPPIPSQILAKDGTVLAEIGTQNREVVEFEKIPKIIVDSFLSAEDANFYEHSGVDYAGIIRAFIANIKAGSVVQGGSTITQQVAKSLLLSRERALSRKIKDFLLAQRLEEKFTKNQILYLYLNHVYLGGGYYGIKSAFKGYFDKELEDATVAESAMVAGLLVAPGRYSPYINPKRARIRQEYVLKRLYENEKITRDQLQSALAEVIKFRLRKRDRFKAGYFTDWIRQRVIELVGEDEFLSNGFKVQTTLDWELQQVAEKQVALGVKEIDKRQGFKGPLASITSEEKTLEMIKEYRKKIYKEKSQFFTIDQNFERLYEIKYEEGELEKIKAWNDEFLSDMNADRFSPGYFPEDRFLEYIEKDMEYDAIVTKIDDNARLVYVNVYGINGVIPYEGFRWAHERVIQEDKNFFPFVTRPSSILKKGDVVFVKVTSKSTGVIPLVYSGYSKAFVKMDKTKLKKLSKQKYLLCELEQEADAQGALVSLDPMNGEIVSLVGGSDFSKNQFNRALQSKRQPGSAFKPILYAAALENGFTPASIIIDSPEALGGVDASLNWKPRNYDGKFKGPVTLRNSLEQSRNVPTIKMADKMGVPLILDFVDRIGFNAKLDQDLSLSLGSFGVTLLDIVSTYGIFPNGGKKITPKAIVSVVDRSGKQYFLEDNTVKEEQTAKEEEKVIEPEPIVDSEIKKEDEEQVEKKQNPFLVALGGDQVYDPRLAYLMTNLLRGVVLNGTGRAAREISLFLGGKTGTTNSYVDAWFIGFSSNLVTGVWTGFDDNKTLGWGETGAKSALPIWNEFMRVGIRKYGERDFKIPLGIINVKIDKETGELYKNSNITPFMEAFVEGTEPGNTEIQEDNGEKAEGISQVMEEDEYYNSQ